MPGQPVRARAHYRNVPRRFTLENRRLPLALPQSFSRPRNAHVFAVENFPPDRRPFATGKRCPLVQKLWTPTLPCGRPWKTKNGKSYYLGVWMRPAPPFAAFARGRALAFLISLFWTQVTSFHPTPYPIRNPLHPLLDVPRMNAARRECRRLFIGCPTRSLP